MEQTPQVGREPVIIHALMAEQPRARCQRPAHVDPELDGQVTGHGE
jgi:hypothetical protein